MRTLGERTGRTPYTRRVFPTLRTPAFLLDVGLLRSNAAAMVQRADELGVALRPHAKTVKVPELMAEVVDMGSTGLTVSTLEEVRTLAGVSSDLLLAVGTAPGREQAILEAMGASDIRLTVAVDSVAALGGVPDDPRVDVAVEIDSDGGRAGIPPGAPALRELVERVGERFRGFFTHAGRSYLAPPDGIAPIARAERDAVLEAVDAVGSLPEMVSVGSTPTVWRLDDASGLTEVRPGVFLLNDRSMVALGVASPGAVAGTVLTTVIGRTADGDVLVDAGWAALGQDRGVPALGPTPGLGATTGGAIVTGATQEHGRVAGIDASPGDRLRIVPNHACATIEMHPSIVVVEGDEVIAAVTRPRGW